MTILQRCCLILGTAAALVAGGCGGATSQGNAFQSVHLVYVAHSGLSARIVQRNYPTGPPTDLYGGEAIGSCMLSADRRRVLFQETPSMGPAKVKVLDRTSGGITVEFEGTYAAWNPDATRIVYIRDGALRTVDSDGRNDAPVFNAWGPRSVDSVEWSPDGTRFALALGAGGERRIAVVNVDGTGFAFLTGGAGGDYAPSWSPDSARIVFVSRRDGNPEIYAIAADGTGLARLTTDGREDVFPVHVGTAGQILFLRDGTFYTMAADGTRVRKLFNPGIGTIAFPSVR